MYIPKHFKMEDREKAIRFMREYNFAILVTNHEQFPVATHLPFLIEENGTDIILVTHMSKTNTQWKDFKQENVLVIFSQPHAFVSPSLYTSEINVPTWNYLAVHAYGIPEIITQKEKGIELLEKTMATFDPKYIEQWNHLPDKYKDGLYDGIVPFTLKVTQLEAKEKISQNKPEADRMNVCKHLFESEDSTARDVAKYMKEKYGF